MSHCLIRQLGFARTSRRLRSERSSGHGDEPIEAVDIRHVETGDDRAD